MEEKSVSEHSIEEESTEKHSYYDETKFELPEKYNCLHETQKRFLSGVLNSSYDVFSYYVSDHLIEKLFNVNTGGLIEGGHYSNVTRDENTKEDLFVKVMKDYGKGLIIISNYVQMIYSIGERPKTRNIDFEMSHLRKTFKNKELRLMDCVNSKLFSRKDIKKDYKFLFTKMSDHFDYQIVLNSKIKKYKSQKGGFEIETDDIDDVMIQLSSLEKGHCQSLFSVNESPISENMPVAFKIDKVKKEVVLIFKYFDNIKDGSKNPAKLLRQIQFLHNLGFCHLDISPRNVVKQPGGLLLVDFDLCTRVGYKCVLDVPRDVSSQNTLSRNKIDHTDDEIGLKMIVEEFDITKSSLLDFFLKQHNKVPITELILKMERPKSGGCLIQ